MNPLFQPHEDALGGLLAGMTQQQAGNMVRPGLNAGLGAAGSLLRGIWNTIDYPRQVLQGEAAAMNPASGHMADPAIMWALGQAIGRMPPGYSRPLMLRQSQQQQYGT